MIIISALARDNRIGSSASDLELVASMKAGDSGALEVLYDRHSRLVYSLALRILKVSTDAEEVTQDAFFQLWRQAGRIDKDRGSVLAWLIVVTRSRALDRLRSRRKLKGEVSEESSQSEIFEALKGSAGISTGALERLHSQERSELVSRALNEIPGEQKQALELAYYEGLSQSEIAERLREPLGTVKTRVRLGMKKLRQVLAGYVGNYESGM